MNNKYKFISFDVWGTLIKHNPEFSLNRNNLIRKIFPEIYISDEMIQNIKKYCDYSNESLGQQLTWEQSLLNILIYNNQYLNIPKSSIKNRLQTFYKEQEELFKKFPPTIFSNETIEVLSKLKEKVNLGICSNTSFITGYILFDLLQTLNISKFFSTFIFSDWVDCSKPNPSIFNEIIIRSKNIPSNILHVGDNNYSDGGCVHLDINFLQINGENQPTISEVLKFV